MALVPYKGFVGGSYRARSSNFDAETCLNLYAEGSTTGTAKDIAVLYGTPGLVLWANLGDGPIRGALRFDASTAYVVSGDTVYRVASNGASGAIGTITFGNDPVSMASNGFQVVISTDPEMWAIDVGTDTVTQVLDPDFLGSTHVVFLAGYFIWGVPNSGRSQYSTLYSTDIEPLSFFTAEASPDFGVAQLADHLEYWYFGESTTEVFSVVADADQPLQRINGAVIEHGCAAPFSVAKMDNTVYWLGADDNGKGTVWRATGAYEPQRVSTPAIEYAISQVEDISGAVAWTYQQESHSFYILNVGDRTWCFDASTALWHERAWRNPVDGSLHRHRGQCQMAFAGKNIVGDWQNGNLYALDLNAYTDNGATIVSRRTGPYVSARTYNMLQVDFETGVGLVEGQGENPIALLQWSDDGGKTWSNDHPAEIGRVGEYQRRVRWRRLGTSRRFGLARTFRVTITDPVKRVITGAMLDIS